MRKAAAQVNSDWSNLTGNYLHIIGFEEVPSDIGTDGQDVINQAIGDQYDAYLGLMGNRIGSPTPRAASGTLEEFERAVARFRADPALRVQFYFSEASKLDVPAHPEQNERTRFKEQVKASGVLYKEFTSSSDLHLMVMSGLANVMQRDSQALESTKR